MRTACLLPVSPSMHCSWGVYLVSGDVPCLGPCTWSWGAVPGLGCTWPGGVYLVLGVYLLLLGVPRGCTLAGGCTWSWGCTLSPGVYLVLGLEDTCPGTPLPVNRMTDRCQNITLPQTSFVGSNNTKLGWPHRNENRWWPSGELRW